ncbi:MAG: hypothetical protein IJ415_03805, partial [Clostridia bacterium]|nr:hypothetical protein [Clostridia bacterium]
MKSLKKNKTKITLLTIGAVLLATVMVLSGVGIYLKITHKENPTVEVNPLDFSIDSWDGKTVEAVNFNENYAGRGIKTKTINSAASFIHFINEVNSGSTFDDFTVYLNSNIDLAGYTINPIDSKFKGIFDGGHYTILNAKINGNSLFANVENATIKNVGLYNCTFLGDGALVGNATNCNLENTFVRLGNGKLVNEFVSNNGTHYIKNSFVDSDANGFIGKIDASSSTENEVTISNCYHTGEIVFNEKIGAVTEINLIKATNKADFANWNYSSTYSTKTEWCDYDYLVGTSKLDFVYPLQAGFVKVYLTGSCYESVMVAGDTVVDATNLATAFEEADKNDKAEINLLVEKIFMEARAEAGNNSEITVNAIKDTTIVRGENNTDSMFVATGSSKIVIGGDQNNVSAMNTRSNSIPTITLDGNRDYFEKNNLESGALVVSYGAEVEIKDNVVIKNSVNTNVGYGGAVLLFNTSAKADINATFENCYAENGGGAVAIVGSGVKALGSFKNCSTEGNGGAVYLAPALPTAETQAVRSLYGNGSNIMPMAHQDITGDYEISDSETYSSCSASNGGAFYVAGNLIISGSPTFSSNKAQASGGGCGGAIYAEGNVEITGNPNFESNQAKAVGLATNANGGAIYSGNDVSITGNSIFTLNNALCTGVAIYSVNITIAGTAEFSDNQGGGAVIYASSTATIAGEVKFETSASSISAYVDSEEPGGLLGGDEPGTTTTSEITAIFTEGDVIISSSPTFSDNYVIHSGGDVIITGNPTFEACSNAPIEANGDVKISGNPIFKSNTNASVGASGGAIYAQGNVEITGNPTFDSNSATNVTSGGKGGAIYAGGDVIITGNPTFTSNSSVADGGAIYAVGDVEISSLPSAYTQVEYIQSSDSQYIDTGFVPDNNTNVEYDFEFLSGTAGSYIPILGQRTSSVTQAFALWVNSSSYVFAVNYDSTDTGGLTGTNCSGRHLYSNLYNNFYIDGTLVTTITAETFTGAHSMIVNGAYGGSGVETRNLSGKIYSLKIWDDGILVRHYIPCYRNSDNTAGLYDLVNKTFETNDGTGAFIVGSTVERGEAIFENNSASNGGAIYASNVTIGSNTNVVLENNVGTNGEIYFTNSMTISSEIDVRTTNGTPAVYIPTDKYITFKLGTAGTAYVPTKILSVYKDGVATYADGDNAGIIFDDATYANLGANTTGTMPIYVTNLDYSTQTISYNDNNIGVVSSSTASAEISINTEIKGSVGEEIKIPYASTHAIEDLVISSTLVETSVTSVNSGYGIITATAIAGGTETITISGTVNGQAFTQTATLTVAKAEYEVEVSLSETLLATGEYADITINVIAADGSAIYTVEISAGTNVEVLVSSTEFTDFVTISDAIKALVAGGDTINISIKDASGTEIYSTSIQVETVSALIALPTEGIATYTGSAITINPGNWSDISSYVTLSNNTQTDAGTYTATATLNDGYAWADGTTEGKTFSFTINPTKLETPVVIMDTSEITWDAISNATSYKVQLYKDGVAYGAPITTTDTYCRSYTHDEGGVYSCAVIAISDNSNHTDSTAGISSALHVVCVTFVTGEGTYFGDGSESLTETYADGSSPYYEMDLHVEDNYNFVGWTTDSNNVTIESDSSIMDIEFVVNYIGGSHDVTITANAEFNGYKVNFAVNIDGYGSTSHESINAVAGSSISTDGRTITIGDQTVSAIPTDSTAEYTYSFTGWSGLTDTVTREMLIVANFGRTLNQYTITFSSSGSGYIEGNNIFTVPYGTKIEFVENICYIGTNKVEAVADDMYVFDYWDTTIEGVFVGGNGVISAYFAPAEAEPYKVTIKVDNPEYGSIGSTEAGGESSIIIEDGGTYPCVYYNSENYIQISLDTLWPIYAIETEDTENYTYNFVGWYINGEKITGDYSFDGDITIEARFERVGREYTITFTSNNTDYGTVSVASIVAEYGTTIHVNDSVVTINSQACIAYATEETAQYTYQFTGWTISSETVTGDMTITANFTRVERTYIVKLVSSDTTKGTVDMAEAGITVAWGTAIKVEGNTIAIGSTTYTASAITGFMFDKWTGIVGAVNGNITITANFGTDPNADVLTVNLSVAMDGSGTISTSTLNVVNGTSIVVDGNTLIIGETTITATANDGYKFVEWQNVPATVTENMTISAVFEKTTSTLTFSVATTGGGTISASAVDVAVGTAITVSGNTLTIGTETVTATANDGYKFVEWQNVPATVTENMNIQAVFEEDALATYTVT